MKCQQLIRNNKQYWFFPDVSLDEQTRGFLVDVGDALLPTIQTIWSDYVANCEVDEQCFSVYVTRSINDGNTLTALFTKYLALPTTQLIVVGRAIPMHSVIIRKKRISAI